MLKKIASYITGIQFSEITGKKVRSTPYRRTLCDLMWLRRSVPFVTVERQMDLSNLASLKSGYPGNDLLWSAIFAKAFAKVCEENPLVDSAYREYHWNPVFQYTDRCVAITVERDHDGEMIIMLMLIEQPDKVPLVVIGEELKIGQVYPLSGLHEFWNAQLLGYLPRFLRRLLLSFASNSECCKTVYWGSFGLSSVCNAGAGLTAMVPLQTISLHYGMLDSDNNIVMRATFDHRVYDAAVAARALTRMEYFLNNDIAEEISSLYEKG